MKYKIKTANKKNFMKENYFETNNELIESYLNGNIIYVKNKFKTMRHENKGKFLVRAKEVLNDEEYNQLVKRLYL